MIEDCIMPVYKTSALRGGMGEMLLRMNCIGNRECEECGFIDDCIVRKIMYPKMKIVPDFMSENEGPGFLVDCEDYRERFSEGDELKFELLLFGPNITYFSQYISAFGMFGEEGLGKEKARFRIVSVKNTTGEEMLREGGFRTDLYKVRTLAGHIRYRKGKIESEPVRSEIKFYTPLTLKYRGEFIKSLEIEPIIEAIKRRIYILDCFEGIESDIRDEYKDLKLPIVIGEEHFNSSVSRFSNHKQEKMTFHGIEGSMKLENVTDEVLTLLLAGELIHIGKNTSFGFGRYGVK